MSTPSEPALPASGSLLDCAAALRAPQSSSAHASSAATAAFCLHGRQPRCPRAEAPAAIPVECLHAGHCWMSL